MKNYFKLIVLILGISIVLSCEKNGSENSKEYKIAQEQLTIDYPNYNLSNVNWSTELGYQIARFSAVTKAASSNTPMITAWYSVNNDKASRQMDAEDLGSTIPELILNAFNATVYSNGQLWIIDEVELENRYNGNGIEKVYQVELNSKTIPDLEAELYFDAQDGKLLYSKESLDEDDDQDSDKFVVNQELIDAVEALYPGAQIIDAEVDNNLIEVEAIITVNNIKNEIELLFDMNYVIVESEIEYEVTYGELTSDFSAVTAWFADPANNFPIPPTTTLVEITEGDLVEDDFIPNLEYQYAVEIDYLIGQVEYEVMFYLDAEFDILKVVPEID